MTCWSLQQALIKFYSDSSHLACLFRMRETSRSTLFFTDVCVGCVFTHVSDVLSHGLALHQGGDPETVVPVAAAEEQFAIVGDHKQSRCYLHAGGEGS